MTDAIDRPNTRICKVSSDYKRYIPGFPPIRKNIRRAIRRHWSAGIRVISIPTPTFTRLPLSDWIHHTLYFHWGNKLPKEVKFLRIGLELLLIFRLYNWHHNQPQEIKNCLITLTWIDKNFKLDMSNFKYVTWITQKSWCHIY